MSTVKLKTFRTRTCDEAGTIKDADIQVLVEKVGECRLHIELPDFMQPLLAGRTFGVCSVAQIGSKQRGYNRPYALVGPSVTELEKQYSRLVQDYIDSKAALVLEPRIVIKVERHYSSDMLGFDSSRVLFNPAVSNRNANAYHYEWNPEGKPERRAGRTVDAKDTVPYDETLWQRLKQFEASAKELRTMLSNMAESGTLVERLRNGQLSVLLHDHAPE